MGQNRTDRLPWRLPPIKISERVHSMVRFELRIAWNHRKRQKSTMPRTLRIQYEGAIYHGLHRGEMIHNQKRIIEAAQHSQLPPATRAFAAVWNILLGYSPQELAKVWMVVFEPENPGLSTTALGTGPAVQGKLAVRITHDVRFTPCGLFASPRKKSFPYRPI